MFKFCKKLRYRNLRKRVKELKTYKLRECISLFGFDPYETNNGIVDAILTAKCQNDAIQKYHKRWKRKYKMKYHLEQGWWSETTYKYGRYMIIDEKGFKTFWR